MKARKLEQLLSAKKARELYLSSYSLSEIYRMMQVGELRAVYEQRGNRRKWSIPLSAIVEFQQQLIPNDDQQWHRERHGLLVRRGQTPRSRAW